MLLKHNDMKFAFIMQPKSGFNFLDSSELMSLTQCSIVRIETSDSGYTDPGLQRNYMHGWPHPMCYNDKALL